MSEKDLYTDLDEERLRKQYNQVKDVEQCDIDATEDQDELRISLLSELEDLESWNDILDKELGKFAKNETYDYVTDLKRAYAVGLSTTEAQMMFKTIPDHVFWDIKTPVRPHEQDNPRNVFNPARAAPNTDFFETRVNEQFLKNRREQRNINPSVSTYRNY